MRCKVWESALRIEIWITNTLLDYNGLKPEAS